MSAEKPAWPGQTKATHVVKDFRFGSGETLPELKLGYFTLGTPRRDANGDIANACLLIHNTTGTAASWLGPGLGGELFAAGQPLDASRWYIVMPDMIGFGGSSKPSDGMRAAFPHFRYADMVEATHRLLTEALGIASPRLVLGLSMGGMLTWMWGERFPDPRTALVPIASQPGPMSGRNWIQRRVSIEAIRNDPDWNGGNYEKQPTRYVRTAPYSGLLIQSVVKLQQLAPTREAGDRLYQQLVERARAGDANDRLYQLEASMDYDPSAGLEKIQGPLLSINFADDELNPVELGVMEPAIARISAARYVLIPAGPATNGHATSGLPAVWKPPLAEFLAGLPVPS